jgi:cytosine deaminase
LAVYNGADLWIGPLIAALAGGLSGLLHAGLTVTLGLSQHVSTSDPRLVTAEALIEVRERVAPYITLQLVAFPQDGYYRAPDGEKSLERALDMGIDVVGGIPHFERTMDDGRRSLESLCRIAAERGLPVDIHCDETDDPMSRHIETLAERLCATVCRVVWPDRI